MKNRLELEVTCIENTHPNVVAVRFSQPELEEEEDDFDDDPRPRKRLARAQKRRRARETRLGLDAHSVTLWMTPDAAREFSIGDMYVLTLEPQR